MRKICIVKGNTDQNHWFENMHALISGREYWKPSLLQYFNSNSIAYLFTIGMNVIGPQIDYSELSCISYIEREIMQIIIITSVSFFYYASN